jgi:hypothetical protein
MKVAEEHKARCGRGRRKKRKGAAAPRNMPPVLAAGAGVKVRRLLGTAEQHQRSPFLDDTRTTVEEGGGLDCAENGSHSARAQDTVCPYSRQKEAPLSHR